MKTINHHIPEALMVAYTAGKLSHVYEVVIAAHISMCDRCRADMSAHEAVAGSVMETTKSEALSQDFKADVLSLLDEPFEAPAPRPARQGIYPGPVIEALKNRDPRWRSVGMGVKQDILSEGQEGSLRLLSIPPGQAVPDHSHTGMELTLVLQGSFLDETGRFGVGDLEIADDDLDHSPVAGDGDTCICLAATGGPLKFNSLVPRLLQPFFRI